MVPSYEDHVSVARNQADALRLLDHSGLGRHRSTLLLIADPLLDFEDLRYKINSNNVCGISPPWDKSPPPLPRLAPPLVMVITPGYRTYTHQLCCEYVLLMLLIHIDVNLCLIHHLVQ